MVAKFRIGKGQTTISWESTLQAIGNGNGSPLTCNDEGEEIVYTHMKVWGHHKLDDIYEVAFIGKYNGWINRCSAKSNRRILWKK